MSNIHGINFDQEGANRRNNRFPPSFQQQEGGVQLDPSLKIPFISAERTEIDNVPPRDETFWQMLKFNFCPSYKIASLTCLVLVLNILVFVLECMASQGLGPSFLQINKGTLRDLGANIPIEIKQNNGYYRLLFSVFLHADFLHILMNQFSIIFIMSSLEYSYGYLTTAGIYLLSGIGGNIFADHFASRYEIFVGCSGATNGLLASILSFFIINWYKLEALGPIREYLLCIFLIIILMTLLSPGPSSIATFAHLGGFLVGLFAGVAIPTPAQNNSYEKYVRIGGLVLLVMFFFLSFLMISTSP